MINYKLQKKTIKIRINLILKHLRFKKIKIKKYQKFKIQKILNKKQLIKYDFI